MGVLLKGGENLGAAPSWGEAGAWIAGAFMVSVLLLAIGWMLLQLVMTHVKPVPVVVGEQPATDERARG